MAKTPLITRIARVFREPKCTTASGIHVFDSQDPDGGWWCGECRIVFSRPPHENELA